MRLLPAILLGFLSASPGLAQQGIERFPNTATSTPILGGVVLPANARIAILSGQVGSPQNGAKTEDRAAYGDTKAQSVAAFEKIKAQLKRMGFAMSDIVKLTVFLVGDPQKGGQLDMAGFSAAYSQFFGTPENARISARSVVQVAGLARPYFLVEIEAIAAQAPLPSPDTH